MKELSSLEGTKTLKTAAKSGQKPALIQKGRADMRPLYAFLIAFVLYLIAFFYYKKYPLGEESILVSDLRVQYAPLLALLKSKFGDLGSVPDGHLLSYLTYSFKLGLGKNFLGIFGYYLSSPFNLLCLLFDEVHIEAAVSTIIVLKLSLSSAFMCLFLSLRTENKKTLWPVLLGIMYAFSMYSQVFMFHIMWLDGYMLLPLILFFTEKFIKERKYLGLVISLLVLFISNYYIAYMAGISCFLYLCVRLFVLKTDIKKAAGICVRYAFAAGFSALATAVMLVPVGFDTIMNSDQTVSARGNNLITYSPLTFIHMWVMGEPAEFNDVLIGNYPFMFICLPVSMLLIIYFLSPLFKGRERKTHAVCLLGAVLSTAFYPLDKAWQVFDNPNWFWHRQVFVFLPMLLVISMNVLLRVKELARKDIVKTLLIMYAFVLVDFSFGRFYGKSDPVVFNLIFITAYAALIAGFGVEKWPDQLRDMPRMLSPFLSVLICFELVFASHLMSSTLETITIKQGSAKEYQDWLNAEIQYGDYVRTRNSNTGAFRAENESTPDFTQRNYPYGGEAIYGNYNGVEFFNSNSNKSMHRFLKQLGLNTNYNYFAAWHTFACPSVDSFFSVGSVSARQDLSFYELQGGDSYGTDLKFYANDSFLPLAFAADKNAMDFDFYRLEKDASEKDYFAFQNDWYRSMFPEEFTDDFFVEIDEKVTGKPVITNGSFFNPSEYVSHKDIENSAIANTASASSDSVYVGYENAVRKELAANMTNIYRTNKNIPIVVEYEFNSPSDQELYCSLVSGDLVDGTEIYVNGIKAYDFSSNTFYSQIFRLGRFDKGENVKVTFISNEDRWSYLNIRFAYFDNEVFAEQVAKTDKTKVQTDAVCDGYARFSFNNIDEDEVIITTIPAEDGWQLYIDGAPAQYTVYQNAFIALDVPSGEHTAELVFTAPGFKAGAMVSCAGVVLLAAFVLIDKKNSKMKEKQK